MTPSGIVDFLTEREGIARSVAVLRAGATRTDLRRAVACGAVDRVRSGVYCVPWLDRAVRMAAAHGGELACASALRRSGVWVLDDLAVAHVWVGRGGRRFAHSDCRCVTHHDDGGAGFGVVGIVRALVQVAACLGDEAFFAAFESAWHLGLLSAADRAEVRASLRAGQRWLIDIARPDAESGLESLLRLRLLRLGIRCSPKCRSPRSAVSTFSSTAFSLSSRTAERVMPERRSGTRISCATRGRPPPGTNDSASTTH